MTAKGKETDTPPGERTRRPKRGRAPRGPQKHPLTPAQRRPFGGGPNPASNPATVIDRAKRLADLEERLAGPYAKADIVAYALEKYAVSARTVYDDLAEIEERWIAHDNEDSKLRRLRARRAWMRRQKKCEDAGEEQAANYALDRLHKITGEFAPERVEVSGRVEIAVDVQIEAFIERLDDEGLRCLAIVRDQLRMRALPAGEAIALVGGSGDGSSGDDGSGDGG